MSSGKFFEIVSIITDENKKSKQKENLCIFSGAFFVITGHSNKARVFV